MPLSPTSPKLLYEGCGCRDSGRRPRRHRCLEAAAWMATATRRMALAVAAAPLVPASATTAVGPLLVRELYALAPQLLLRLFCLVAETVRRCMALPLEVVSAGAPPAATSVPADIIPADAAVDATIAADADAKARPRPRYPALGGRCVCLEFLPMLEGVVSGYVILRVSHTVAGAVTAVVINAGGGAFGLIVPTAPMGEPPPVPPRPPRWPLATSCTVHVVAQLAYVHNMSMVTVYTAATTAHLAAEARRTSRIRPPSVVLRNSCRRLLDMGTGAGEWFQSLSRRPRVAHTVSTPPPAACLLFSPTARRRRRFTRMAKLG